MELLTFTQESFPQLILLNCILGGLLGYNGLSRLLGLAQLKSSELDSTHIDFWTARQFKLEAHRLLNPQQLILLSFRDLALTSRGKED